MHFDIRSFGDEQPGLVFKGGASQQRGDAGFVGRVHIGTGLDQKFQHVGISLPCGGHQWRVVGVIVGTKVRSGLQQFLDDGGVAGADGFKERCAGWLRLGRQNRNAGETSDEHDDRDSFHELRSLLQMTNQ